MQVKSLTKLRKTRKDLSSAKHSSSLIILKSEVPLFILIKEIKVAMKECQFRELLKKTFIAFDCLIEMNLPVVLFS